MKTYIVDAFTDEAFKGNPAGVCILKEPISEDLMQSVAAELNLSETAFIQKVKENNYAIRYFSPKSEIPFCGHATLASSKVLFEKYDLEQVQFNAINNLTLSAIKKREGILMKFPLYGTVSFDKNEQVIDALGLASVVNCRYAEATNMMLLEIDDYDMLVDLRPDFIALQKSIDTIDGIIVTVKSKNSKYDFYSRYFWPWVGTNEDPVTGAAHTVLAKYWGDKLRKKDMMAYQASERGGYMNLKIVGSDMLEVKSNAVIVFEGIINI